MFPLAHTYLINELIQQPKLLFDHDLNDFERKLFLVGGVIPDMVVGMGADRIFGHSMGKKLYQYCQENYPEAATFALGAWLHGIDPCGFDYYADEHWQGGNGWCFQTCEPYIPAVIESCQLPQEWGLWKAHNFVEMSCDHICTKARPEIGPLLIESRSDRLVQDLIAELMHKFAGLDYERVHGVVSRIGDAFAILDVSFIELGNKYAQQLFDRHQIENARPKEIAQTLEKIAADIEPEFFPWYQEVKGLILTEIQKELKIKA
jgi:hypothetical protein